LLTKISETFQNLNKLFINSTSA